MRKEELIRTKIPLSKDLPAISFFDSQKEVILDSGLRCLFIHDETQPLITIKLLVKRGSALEDLPGISNFTVKMMMKGTDKLTSKDIARETEYYGITMNFQSKWDDSVFQLVSLSDHIDNASEVFFDCLLNSSFPEQEVNKMKKQMIAGIKQNWSDSGFLSKYAFADTYYHNHPYGNTLTGFSEDVEKITRKDCIAWKEKLIIDSEITLLMAGNFDEKKMTKIFNNKLSGHDFSNNKSPVLDKADHRKDDPIAVIDKADAKQTSLRMGKPAIDRMHPDFPLLQVCNTVFGGYFKSRLNDLIREKLGYTYGIQSGIDSRLYGNALVVAADLNTGSTKDAIDKVLNEMKVFSSENIIEEEQSIAIQHLLGSFARMMETPQQKLSLLAGKELFSLPDDYHEKFFDRIKRSSLDDIFEIQKKYFKPEHIVIAVAGNADYLADQLSDIGNVIRIKNKEF